MQSQTPEFLINQHRIADRRGADDYLARLGEVDRKFDQVIEGLALREHMGVVPPRFVIERVLAEIGLRDTPVRENPLYMNFAGKLEALPDVTPDDKQALAARCAQAIEAPCVPAYRKLIAFLRRAADALQRPMTVYGSCRTAMQYYEYLLRHETTTKMTPQKLHELGLSEMARTKQR